MMPMGMPGLPMAMGRSTWRWVDMGRTQEVGPIISNLYVRTDTIIHYFRVFSYDVIDIVLL